MKALQKTTSIILTLTLALALTACSTFTSLLPGAGKSKLPAVLEYTVGTPGATYSTTADTPGGLDGEYTTYLCTTFNDTTPEDHTALMAHYRQSSIGNIGDDRLVFDWGLVKITQGEGSITVEAYID